MTVAFIDIETTGLHPDKHQIWEVGLITPDEREHVWQFPVDELTADPFALDIGRYWDRHWGGFCGSEVSVFNAIYDAHNEKSRRKNFPNEGRVIHRTQEWCVYFRDLVGTSHLCGAVPSFDEERLRRLLRSQGVLPRWHYHLIDVEALAVGYLAGRNSLSGFGLPWKSTELWAALGIVQPEDEKHTALGDARSAKRLYEKVMGG